jgi:hypothetical protein
MKKRIVLASLVLLVLLAAVAFTLRAELEDQIEDLYLHRIFKEEPVTEKVEVEVIAEAENIDEARIRVRERLEAIQKELICARRDC